MRFLRKFWRTALREHWLERSMGAASMAMPLGVQAGASRVQLGAVSTTACEVRTERRNSSI